MVRTRAFGRFQNWRTGRQAWADGAYGGAYGGTPGSILGAGLHRLGEAFGGLGDHHMVTVLWLTSIPALFMFWFYKRLKSVRLMARFPEPEPAPTNLVYAGSRA